MHLFGDVPISGTKCRPKFSVAHPLVIYQDLLLIYYSKLITAGRSFKQGFTAVDVSLQNQDLEEAMV